YDQFSFIDVLQGKIPTTALKDKILLIGTMAKEDPSDFAATPYSKNQMSNPKIAIHANILDSVLNNHGILRVPVWINGLLTFILSAFIFWWVMTAKPLAGLL